MSNAILPNLPGSKAPGKSLFSRFLLLLILACASLFLATGVAQAADTEEEYLKIFNLIEQGDTLQKTGDSTRALVKYREAEVALKNFRRDNPGWNPKLVTYRWNDLGSKIAVAQDAAPTANTNSAAAVPRQTPPASKASAATGNSTVKLLQAGAEPRKVLRLTPKAGDQQTMGMTLKMGMEIKMGEMEMPAMNIPPISMDMNTTVKEVSPAGDITYEMAMGEATLGGDADSSPEMVAAMKSSMEGVKGMTSTARISNRGINLGMEMKMPDSASAQMRQALDQVKDSMDRVSSPLPEEAVGPGAKWESGTTVKSQGMTIKQVATYELVSIEGDRAVIKSTITQTAADQKISNPSMPGIKVDVIKMTSKGGGSATWELSKILPVTGNIDLKSEMTMGVPAAGQQQTMSMNMGMSLQMESK